MYYTYICIVIVFNLSEWTETWFSQIKKQQFFFEYEIFHTQSTQKSNKIHC